MTLNCGIQKGTAPLVALAVGVALDVVELDEVAVTDDVTVLTDGCEVDPDEAEGVELPPGEEDKLPVLSVDDATEPVILEVGSPGEPVLVVNVEGAPELTLLGVVGREVVEREIVNERLVFVIVVGTGVPGESELREGVEPLAEPLVEVDWVVNDVVGKGASVLLRLEELNVGVSEPGEVELSEGAGTAGEPLEEVDGLDSVVVGAGKLPVLEDASVWVDELGELEWPPEVDVESSPDEMLAEEALDVTSAEDVSVPETVCELEAPLLLVGGSNWLSVVDVNDVEED